MTKTQRIIKRIGSISEFIELTGLSQRTAYDWKNGMHPRGNRERFNIRGIRQSLRDGKYEESEIERICK